MTQLPEINWQAIRGKAPSGSRRDGFEELGSQLMIYGGLVDWPAGTTFNTFGNPDGGREGRGVLPGGAVWAWQTKYLFKLDDPELGQIDKSVKRVLATEPNLERYYVLLPYNPPAGDREDRKSAWTKWNTKVEAWQTAAAAVGLSVTFEYIGETQLHECLLQPSQVGRLRYWFDLDTFSEDRFRAIAARAEADAGGRYSPELNVELPIAAVFDGLARTPAFAQEIRTSLATLRTARGAYGLSRPEEEPELFAPRLTELEACLDALDAEVDKAIARTKQIEGILPDLAPFLDATCAPLDKVGELLRQYCLRDRLYIGNAGHLNHQTLAIKSAIAALYQLLGGRAWRSFNQTAILVTGTGGAGKTHLLCDLAKARTANGQPTIIALGEQFERGPIETDLGRIIGFTSPANQLLATFDAASETAGVVGLIVIDGLNEAVDRGLWNRYLRSFLNEVVKHRHIRLVLSCRTEFLTDTLSDDLRARLSEFQHTGFKEVSRDAIGQFLDWYGIERPSFPMLDPEFTNPLFLKLLCTTLQTRGEHRFPRSGVGTSWVYDSLLDAIDERLSQPERCDYDRNSALVRQAVERIAAAMVTTGRRLPAADVEEITRSLLPTTGWSKSLLNGMLKEAILSEVPMGGTRCIRFGYERLGDIALARHLTAEGLDELTTHADALARSWHLNAGVLQALASVLPETRGVELIDLLSSPCEYQSNAAYTDFLFSIAWRAPTAVTERTVELLTELWTNPDFADAVYNALLQVATIPGNPLNATWLHQRLHSMTLPERDATWSHFCDWQDANDSGARLSDLIGWAWSDASLTSTDETRELAALTLGWTLAASYRPIRDNATKAIIAILEPAAHLYPSVLQRFAGCGDDAIEERLLAVGCGIAQRTLDPGVATVVAEAVRQHTVGRGYWPQNYLGRDYARRAIDAALEHGWRPDTDDLAARVRSPYTTDWIAPQRSTAEIDELCGPPDYQYGPVGHAVLSDLDDFRKYYLDLLVRYFRLEDGIDQDYLGRVLFDQVLALGWTPARFAAMDRNLRRTSPTPGEQHEGFARKYLWTAFKQLVGRIADRYALDARLRDDERTEYQTPRDVYGHDIDPTMLLRRTDNHGYEDTPTTWFAPAAATFPDRFDNTWLTNDDHSPPADQLLVCTDQAGRRWLLLEGQYQWSQPQHPEDAAAGLPYHRTWMQIRSYLVDTDELEAWKSWLPGQDWYGRWMPESGSPTGLLLADHPYKSDWPNLISPDRLGGRTPPPPGKLVVATTWYGGVANDMDQSDSKHLYTFLPSTALGNILDLERIEDFRWGHADQPLAEAFAARQPGPDSVHINAEALSSGLGGAGKHLLWTVLAEKETITQEHSWPEHGQPVGRTYSASYLLDGSQIRLVDANARTLRAGEEESESTVWDLPTDIPT